MFRFESYWVPHPGFHQVVKDSWSKTTQKSNSAANLNAKFKRLRYDLKYRSKSISRLTISRLTVCIQNTNNALLELDIIEDSRTLSVAETNFRTILKKHLDRLLEYQNS
jgi:hypothetical protein